MPRVTQPADLTAVECQADWRGPFISRNNLNRQAESDLDDFGSIVGPVTGCYGAKFDRCLGCEPLLHACDARRLGHAEDKIILRRHPDVFKLERIELDARFGEKLLQELSANEMADGKAVGLGYFEEMIRRNQSPGARHVVHDDGRVVGNILAKMTRDKTGVGVVPASGRGANNNPNGFALVERRSAICQLPIRSYEHRQKN